jgi:hypothetical protein
MSIDGEIAQVVTASGPGLRSLLGLMQVYPTLGLGRRLGTERPLNWAGGSMDRSVDWIAATERKAVRDPSDPYSEAPQGFPLDPDEEWLEPYWISARPSVTPSPTVPPQRVGDEYFFEVFEVPEQTDAGCFWSADDGLEIWIDDRRWAQETEAFLWMETKTFGLVLDPGIHHIAVKLTNIERENVETNGAAFTLAIHKMLDGGATVGEPLVVSNGNWLVAEVPEPAPTMTPGEILDMLLGEAQGRGCFPWLTWDFTAAADSNSQPWATPVDLIATVGRPVSTVVGALEEVSIDLKVTPAGEIVAGNKGTLGEDKSSTVVLSPVSNLSGQGWDAEGPIANAALVQYGTGLWVEATHPASIGAYGRLEGAAEIGSADSKDQVDRVLAEWFTEHAVAEYDVAVEVEPVPGAVPGVDFDVFDRVTVPWGGGTAVMVVERIEVAELDPARDPIPGGTQLYVVHGSLWEVLS